MKPGYTPSTLIITIDSQLGKQKNMLQNIKDYYSGKATGFVGVDSAELAIESANLVRNYYKMLLGDIVEKSGEQPIRKDPLSRRQRAKTTSVLDRAMKMVRE